jgi:pimeloyl-ACP methyl ester carboxylesterase
MPFLTAGGHRLEYEFLRAGTAPDRADDRPTLVFLHEGLGSVSLWRDFPRAVVDATGCDALLYSRWGHGRSDGVDLPRPLDFMTDEARVLTEVLAQAGVTRALLVGHSDGGSIALLHAAGAFGPPPGPERLSGLVLLAPHVFVEDISVASIQRTRDEYRADRRDKGLRERLRRHHGDQVDGTLYGWADTWLHPEFRRTFVLTDVLPRIAIPVLLIQGKDDQYGTLAQVDAICAGVRGPAQRLVLPDCGHSPHRDRPQETLLAIAQFVAALHPPPRSPGAR